MRAVLKYEGIVSSYVFRNCYFKAYSDLSIFYVEGYALALKLQVSPILRLTIERFRWHDRGALQVQDSMEGRTLVILAAGKGSRFGGLKQLQTFQPQNATLAEFAIWDALKAGFDRVVAIVREETKAYFEAVFEKMHIVDRACCVLQKIDNLFQSRTKPLGTGHALLSAIDVIHTPFVIVNGDDFYGSEAYRLARNFLENNTNDFALVGYPLKETLSKNGYVSRGLCSIEGDRVVSIHEHTHIECARGAIISKLGASTIAVDPETFVSMNFWILRPSILQDLKTRWQFFIKHLKDPQNDEFFLPDAIRDIAMQRSVPIRLLKNPLGGWLGITYADDIENVQKTLLEQTMGGVYPKIF